VWLVQSPTCSTNLIPHPFLTLNLNPFYLNLGCLGVDEPVCGQLASLWVGSKFHLGFGVSKFALAERQLIGRQLLLRATPIYGQVRSLVNSIFLWINWWIAWRFLCIFKLNLNSFSMFLIAYICVNIFCCWSWSHSPLFSFPIWCKTVRVQ
jgi:hypothetical protein